VYQTASTLPTAQVQFDIAYGDALGSGSVLYNPIVPSNSYTKTIYGQYRSMILEDENSSFTFGIGNNTYVTNNFWILSIERANYKQSLFPGSLNLQLSGSGGIIKLTDNSQDVLVNHFKDHTWRSLFIFMIGFVTLGVFWVGSHFHHHHLVRTDRISSWLNLLFLMFICVIPFSIDFILSLILSSRVFLEYPSMTYLFLVNSFFIFLYMFD
jgi:hypothetical protein